MAIARGFSRKGDCLRNHERTGGVLLLFASSPTPKPFVSQPEFAPGKSHILGKGSVRRSDLCFIPSLWFPF